VVSRFLASGVSRPWQHQVSAADAAHDGSHVVLATGTASGKSLAYLLPALTAITSQRGAKGQRGSTALYLAPTKALAHDQANRLRELAVPDLRFSTHDGDSPTEQREWTREHAEYVLTNPDMLHFSLLPSHERWASFFKRLDYVVVDEMHHYRGLFGAHVANVLRRLRRVCAHHGSSPTFIFTSATIAEPAEAASRLAGVDAVEVTTDGSPHGRTTLAFWEPGTFVDDKGKEARRPPHREVADLFCSFVAAEIPTLAFAGSRRASEAIAQSARGRLGEMSPHLAHRVASYRGGYLPEERRALEADLRSGRLVGMAATQALELGIDINGLDAIVMTGFPGTRAAFWQQVGRAGRDGRDALAVLVAREDQLDQYLLEHPEFLLGQPVESFTFDPSNPQVLGPHLCAAAAEVPLTDDGPLSPDLFGPTARDAVAALTEAGMLRRRPRGWFWTERYRAVDLADLRSSGGRRVSLIEDGTGRVIGTVEAHAAPATAHTGAVYLHQGDVWTVADLDLDAGVAEVRPGDPGYITNARSLSDVTILEETSRTTLGHADLMFGTIEYSSQVVSYLAKSTETGQVLAETLLDMPVQTHRTEAVWWTLPEDVIARSAAQLGDQAGAAHAAEHAAIGLLPLIATCDRWDIGGLSTLLHPQTGTLTVFIYDGRAGGAGIARSGFENARRWLTVTRERIADCLCALGCPACVQSPKCGNQNHPLDKAGAIALLDLLINS
jgi:DEAD/DEAH box helicase domain-containing protein